MDNDSAYSELQQLIQLSSLAQLKHSKQDEASQSKETVLANSKKQKISSDVFIEPLLQCVICLSEFKSKDGIKCVQNHFICDKDFETLVKTGSCEPDIHKLRECKGLIFCPAGITSPDSACKWTSFSSRVVARTVSDETFDVYLDAQKRIIDQDAFEKYQAEIQKEFEILKEAITSQGLQVLCLF